MGQERPRPGWACRKARPIESRMVTRRIEGAQKKVEERNFEVRKNLLEYDEVMDEQRKRVYGFRQRILDGVNCRELDPGHDPQADRPSFAHGFWPSSFGSESFASVGRNPVLARRSSRRTYRGLDFDGADRTGQGRGRADGRNPNHRAPSTRTCRSRSKTKANGTGKRWPSWPTSAGI